MPPAPTPLEEQEPPTDLRGPTLTMPGRRPSRKVVIPDWPVAISAFLPTGDVGWHISGKLRPMREPVWPSGKAVDW